MSESGRSNFHIETGTPTNTDIGSASSAPVSSDFLREGREAFLRGDRESAARAYRAAGDLGSAEAAHILGLLRRDEGRLDDLDPDGATAWLKRAVGQGRAAAATEIGHIRKNQGRTSDEDSDGAVYWYKAAAAGGSAAAMNNLGILRREAGRLDGADGAEHWYRAAAEAGNPKAMFNLGLLRERQHKVRRPPDDCAVYWLRQAQAAGYDQAGEVLSVIQLGRLARRRLRETRYQAE